MQKKSKKQDIELAALLFLVGLLLFFYPVVTQVSSYQADEEAYEDLAMEYMPPEISPEPVLPLPKKTDLPTDDPPQDEMPVTLPASSEAEAQENEDAEPTITAEVQSAFPAPSDEPVSTGIPESTEVPVLPTEESAAVTTAAVTPHLQKNPLLQLLHRRRQAPALT